VCVQRDERSKPSIPKTQSLEGVVAQGTNVFSGGAAVVPTIHIRSEAAETAAQREALKIEQLLLQQLSWSKYQAAEKVCTCGS
jgi:hypothetical protein